MAVTINSLLKYALKNVAKIGVEKATLIAYNFGSISGFKAATLEDFLGITFQDGGKALKLNRNEYERIKLLQEGNFLDSDLSIRENIVTLLSKKFLLTQIESIKALELESMSCNPILVSLLKLDTAEDVIRYYVYQSVQRGIVTSAGFLVQELLLTSGENIHSAQHEESLHGTKWDLVKITEDMKYWIEVKAGPNDLNKTQIMSYKRAIESAEGAGFKAYIGETYGKRDDNTVTHTLYRSELPEWENRTLIGRELWNFVSDDPEYHNKLVQRLNIIANDYLKDEHVVQIIDNKIEELIPIFKSKYPDINDFINDLW